MSVIIPCYRYGHLLDACLTSVLGQQGPSVEVLVIDDASPDCTPEVMSSWVSDSRVSYRRHAKNLGNIATYNEGLEWAQGDYTVLLSADDLLVPGALDRAATLLDAKPRVGFVYGGCPTFTENNDLPPVRTSVAGWTIWLGREWIRIRTMDGHNCISSPEVMVRTSVQRAVGGYRADLRHAGDLEMWLRIAKVADVGYLRGADQAYYRTHPGSMLRSQSNLLLSDLQQRRSAFDATHIVGTKLHRIARRTLAREALRAACRAYDRGRVEETPIDALGEYARESFDVADHLPEAYGLRWRRRLPAWLLVLLQPVQWVAIGRKVQAWWWWQSVARYGA